MSIIKRSISILLIVCISLLMINGCKETTTGTGPQQLAAITNLSAYSVSATAVALAWALSASESASGFNNYQVTVKLPDGTTFDVRSVAKGVATVTITGLTEGVVYTFDVVATAASGQSDFTSSNTASTKWSPARRLNDDNTGLPIKVYETSSSSSFGSGLILFEPASSKPKVVSIASPGADALLIDLYLRTHASTAGSVELRSASLFNAAWRLTRFSSVYRDASSLDDPQVAPPDTTTFSASNTSVQFDSVTVSSSRIYYFKGDQGNYGRILVQRNPANGTLLWGSSPEQYLNLKISYQTVAYNPYSKRRF